MIGRLEKTVIDCPDPAHPQQLHLDIHVSDPDQAGHGVPGQSFVLGSADEPVLVHEYAFQRAGTGDSVLVIW